MRQIYLSNTSMQTFLNCKRKYKFRYVDKIPNGQNSTSKHLSFGNSMHMALAQFNMLTEEKYKTLENLHKLFRRNWIREGYESIEEERDFGLKGLDMLSKYYEDPKDPSSKNLVIEEMIKMNLDDQYVLCGKLDKAYIHQDEKHEILDYKTGLTLSPLNPLQMSIYLILMKHRTGKYPDRVAYYYLAENKKN